jgi:ribosomal subunit interface protein
MQLPLQITFRDLPRSEAVETEIREKVEKLNQFSDRIVGCRVTLGLIRKHKHQGRLYNVRVDLTVPGSEIVINRDRAEDLYVAIRDAFDHAKRKLEDYARRIRGDTKVHEEESRGRIIRLFGDEGYGFVQREADGTEFYFHRFNVVHPDFDQLNIGDEVVFLEEAGAEGPQANRVHRH